MEKIIQVPDGKIMAEVFGNFDENIKMIEKRFNVTINNRDEIIKISGSEKNSNLALESIEGLIAIAEKGEQIIPQNVNYVMDMACDRCLAPVPVRIDLDFERDVYSPEVDAGDDAEKQTINDQRDY